MNIEEFLYARIDEMELAQGSDLDLRGHTQALRNVIEWHKNWPVLVETRPKYEMEPDPNNINSYVYRMQQDLAWATQEQYIKKFGVEPISAPILRILAQPYSDHVDFNPEWAL